MKNKFFRVSLVLVLAAMLSVFALPGSKNKKKNFHGKGSYYGQNYGHSGQHFGADRYDRRHDSYRDARYHRRPEFRRDWRHPHYRPYSRYHRYPRYNRHGAGFRAGYNGGGVYFGVGWTGR
ncbi:MAG: hypothetical protein KA419_16550 [Acidobacteria bacterium]|nr:hypothetical protein [Acidobacteriota bacterium]